MKHVFSKTMKYEMNAEKEFEKMMKSEMNSEFHMKKDELISIYVTTRIFYTVAVL